MKFLNKYIIVSLLSLVIVFLGFFYFQLFFNTQKLKGVFGVTQSSVSPISQTSSQSAQENKPLLAISFIAQDPVSFKTKESGVITFDSDGKQINPITLPHEDIRDPLIQDWSLDKKFLAVSGDDSSFSGDLYIYDFNANKLESLPDKVRSYLTSGGNEMQFSPNGKFFYAPRNDGRWLGYRDISGWNAIDLNTIVPDKSIKLLSGSNRWNPTEPATIFVYGYSSDEKIKMHTGWIIDFREGLDKVKIIPIPLFQQLQEGRLHISGFEWSSDGKHAFLSLYDGEDFFKTNLLNFDGSQFSLKQEDIVKTISNALFLNKKETLPSFTPLHLSAVSPTKIFFLTGDGARSGVHYYGEKDGWRVYDIQDRSIKNFFTEEGNVANDYIWSPTSDYLAIRSEGTIRLISPEGIQIFKDSMDASGTIAGYGPTRSIGWDRSGKYIAYLQSSKNDGVIGKIYDTVSKTTKSISMSKHWFTDGRITTSLLFFSPVFF